MEKAELHGIWWLPTSPDKRVSGVLRFGDERLHLALIGGDFEGQDDQDPVPIVVHGATEEHMEVTLEGCRRSAWRGSSSGYRQADYRVRVGYLGKHLLAPEEQRYDVVEVEFTHLHDWVAISGIERNWEFDPQKPFQVHVSYNQPPPIIANTSRGAFEIRHRLNSTGGRFASGLREFVGLIVRPTDGCSLDRALKEFVWPFQDLISIATDTFNGIERLKLYWRPGNADAGEDRAEVTVLFASLRTRHKEHRPIYSHDMIFCLQDIADEFERVIEFWLDVAERLGSAVNLLLATEYNPGLYAEQRFLMMAQAAETYHRRAYPNAVAPASVHEARITAILDAVPANCRRWLSEQLRWSNEPRLRKRLRDLLIQTSEVTGPLIGGSRKAFVEEVVNTRNYLTHFTEELKEKSASPSRRFALTVALSYIVRDCLLAEMGLDPQKRKALFNRNQKYLFALHEGMRMWSESSGQ